ncbi:MAG: two-component system response regulator [Bdellovibrionales bacterium]
MRLRVLIVDDEPDLCEVFQSLFTNEQCTVEVHCQVQSALDSVAKSPPDLVILDYRMPVMNGEQFAREIPAHIPVILITGDLSVRPAGRFVRVFSKPANLDEVKAFVLEQRWRSPSNASAETP